MINFTPLLQIFARDSRVQTIVTLIDSRFTCYRDYLSYPSSNFMRKVGLLIAHLERPRRHTGHHCHPLAKIVHFLSHCCTYFKVHLPTVKWLMAVGMVSSIWLCHLELTNTLGGTSFSEDITNRSRNHAGPSVLSAVTVWLHSRDVIYMLARRRASR